MWEIDRFSISGRMVFHILFILYPLSLFRLLECFYLYVFLESIMLAIVVCQTVFDVFRYCILITSR